MNEKEKNKKMLTCKNDITTPHGVVVKTEVVAAVKLRIRSADRYRYLMFVLPFIQAGTEDKDITEFSN